MQKPPHCRNSDKTLAMKNRFAKIGNNYLYTIRVSLAYYCLIVVSPLFANSV